ncbi:hypothetical protein WJX74_009883 [Apatococcus lobatus]|uniref:Mitochondrial glycoprotein n=1 Tax=Apatococcus lobatus TaxID=904363 RepID=A0AAW1QTY8_9CHLO
MLCKSIAAGSVAALGRTSRHCPFALSQAAAVTRQQHFLASRSPAPAKPQLRAFASSPLADVLQQELDYELDTDEKPEELTGGPPKPFQLTESPGDTLLRLKRDFHGEEIEITASVNDQPETPEYPEEEEGGVGAEDDPEDDPFPGLDFEVTVTKGDQRLAFECVASGEDVVIARAALEPASREVEDTFYFGPVLHVSLEPSLDPPSLRTFQGPVYQELDDKLQEEFANYLHERGVNEALGNYLIALVNDKEEQEYKRWLGNVRKFILK